MISKNSSQEHASLIHELQVHQLELEMQNNELHKIQAALDIQRREYFDLYNLAPIGYCTLSEEGKILQANEAASLLLGMEKERLIEHFFTEFIAREDQDIYYFFRKDFSKSCELRLIQDSHTYHWVELSARRSRNNMISLIIHDISDRKAFEDEQRVAAIAFESQSGMVITDHKGNIIRVNPAFTRLTGFDALEVIGKRMDFLHSGHQDKLFYQQMWQTLNTTHRWQGEIWNKRKDDTIYVEFLTITAVIDPKGNTTHYIGNFSDITDDKEAQAVIYRLAYYDPMTKLPNRRLFQEHLNQAIVATSRSNLYGAIFFIDLDNFKELNDTQGHDIGDLLLIEVSKRLLSNVREEDTVSRQGGDEFIILLENLHTDIEKAALLTKQIGTKLLESINKPFLLNNYEYYCKLSIGIELFHHLDNAEILFKHADIALYQAKNSGGNQLLFFNQEMQNSINQRMTMESELKQAIKLNQFCLYYQPQINNDLQVAGVEALIRWEHPKRGLISPNDFIPLAEETGLILPIGLWVIQTACKQLKSWQDDPLTCKLPIAVNVSARQFRQDDFLQQIEDTLKESGADPKLLKLELTESLVLENIQEVILKMHKIKDLGINFSMDDFGTGYSSLSYLAKLPLYQLKIDRSFIQDLPDDKNNAMITRTVISMGLGLDMNVIAEGVENKDQYEFLKANGCNAYQGYIFSHPLDIKALNLYLHNTISL